MHYLCSQDPGFSPVLAYQDYRWELEPNAPQSPLRLTDRTGASCISFCSGDVWFSEVYEDCPLGIDTWFRLCLEWQLAEAAYEEQRYWCVFYDCQKITVPDDYTIPITAS